MIIAFPMHQLIISALCTFRHHTEPYGIEDKRIAFETQGMGFKSRREQNEITYFLFDCYKQNHT